MIKIPFKAAIKQTLGTLGYTIEKLDPLDERIPADYSHSPFCHRVFCRALDRDLDFKDMVEKVQDGKGDARRPGADKAIDEFSSSKPETMQPHSQCTWTYHVIKH